MPSKSIETNEDVPAKTLVFSYLPDYARFLLNNKLEEFVATMLTASRQLQLPLLKFFEQYTDEQLIEMGKGDAAQMLAYLAENKAEKFVENSITDFEENRMSTVSNNQVLSDDINMVSYIRRYAFRKLMPYYNSDTETAIGIMEEVDTYTSEIDKRAMKLLFTLQKDIQTETQSLAKIGNWIWEWENKRYIWSDEVYKIYELNPLEPFPEDINSYNHPDDSVGVDEKIREAKETLQPFEFDYRIVLKDGKVKMLHVTGQVKADKNGAAKSMFGTLQDMTLIEKKNEALRASEDRYHKMVEQVVDYAIIMLDKDGIIQNWNKGAELIKGYKAEEAVGKHFSTFYLDEDKRKKVPQDLIETAAKNGTATNEGFRIKKDGILFWGNTVITALRDKDNNLIGFTKLTRDLTDQKIAQEKLIQYSQLLEQKNIKLEQSYKEMESFSYVASHDLQEPLRKIKTFINLIDEDTSLSETSRNYFKRIFDSASRMQDLIKALLDYSLTTDTSKAREIVDLNTILEDVKSNLQETIEEKKAVITISPLPTVTAVPLQMHQLFVNIISNGLKYSKPGITPEITVSYEVVSEEPRIYMHKNYYKISIADNGIGFDQKYADKVFDLFQRLHGKNEYSGTGIGLAICKKIVQNHDGFINAQSEPGAGTVFNIYLPTETPVTVDEE